MKIYYFAGPKLPLPDGHRFPAEKYSLLRERVLNGALGPFAEPVPSQPATDSQLLLVHEAEYLHKLKAGMLTDKELRRLGLPCSPELVERSRCSVGATIAACRAAAADGLAVNLGGGTHHAHAGHGEGYCVFNDIAVAARVAQAEGIALRLAVIDCDVHQGDGTAAIFADDPTVFTFSIHAQKNFPYRKVESDLDLGLPDGAGDDEYLLALQAGLEQTFAHAKAGMVIYVAGADPYQGDSLGRLKLSKAGLQARDELVLSRCRALNLPVALTFGGGYANPISDTVDIHLQTLRVALQLNLQPRL